MNIKTNKSGFTLLEIIIVIIIIGVLASLALPRFFSTVEFSRSTEALNTMSALRGSIERCYLQNGNYTTCLASVAVSPSSYVLDIANPNAATGRLFTYTASTTSADAGAVYTITAVRTTKDGGSTGSKIYTEVFSDGGTKISGEGAFQNIK